MNDKYQPKFLGSLHLFSDVMHGPLQTPGEFLKITEEFRNYFDTKEDIYDKKDEENFAPTDIFHSKNPLNI